MKPLRTSRPDENGAHGPIYVHDEIVAKMKNGLFPTSLG